MPRKAYVSIAQWWLKDDDGNPVSVYKAYQTIEGSPNQVTRHTLTRARDGKLEKGDFSNLKKLARICSEWSGEIVTVDDLIVEIDD